MAKPKIPNQRNKYKELNKRLAKYATLVEKLYDAFNLEASKAVSRTDYSTESDKPFKWSDYPQTKKQIDDIQNKYTEELTSIIHRGTSDEWKNSNEVQDLVVNKALTAYSVTNRAGQEYKRYYQNNPDALESFQNRKIGGLGLSKKIWNLSDQYKNELEVAISVGLEKGMSANQLAREIKRLLNEPDKLFRRVRDKFGNLVLSKNAKLYHPGQGVYRSSFKNARRLAVSEINMAYRQAENYRWSQMDFIVGYEIKLSNNHTCNGKPFHDICDDLKGKYPKEFKWTQWHPLCRCYKVPIFKTEEEFWEWDGEGEPSNDSVNKVKDMPDAFKKWAEKNEKRMDEARERGTLPYFIRDNFKDGDVKKGLNKGNTGNSFAVTTINDTSKSANTKLIIKSDADKTELSENKRAAKAIINAYPDTTIEIRSHVLEYGVKNPEYLINGRIGDRKGIHSERGIANAFNKAKKQGCEVVVIDLDAEYNKKFSDLRTKKLSKELSYRESDFRKEGMYECYVVYNGKAIRIPKDAFVGDKEDIQGRIIAMLETIKER